MFDGRKINRSAVDSVLNSPNLNDPNSPTPYIEFADVSRIHDGPVLGEQVSAPEIAALVYTSGQQDSGKRAAVNKTMNRPNDYHVPFPSYWRQRISSESIFKLIVV